ncbi:MAG: S8 family serine peptidase, partial [Nanoarchaeota archaeon]|nr:S8 family serine peptidase [Nanoarchaeota archaeon]
MNKFFKILLFIFVFQLFLFSVYSQSKNDIDRKIIVKFKDDSLAAKLIEEGGKNKFVNSGLAEIESFDIETSNLQNKYTIYGQVRERVLKNRLDRGNKLDSNDDISEIEKRGFIKFEVKSWETYDEAIKRIKSIYGDDIEIIEVDVPLRMSLLPNDPSVVSQWHHSKIGSYDAWNYTRGEGVIVGIGDTGADDEHPDLIDNLLLPGWNTVYDNNDILDVNGHGTKVIGTTAAVGNNSNQVAGVAYNSKIIPIKVSGTSNGYAYMSDLAGAIYHAADNGAKVVSLSYGVCSSSTIRIAADYMESKGGVVVVAAGNSYTNISSTNYDSVICVSATASNDLKTSWSNYGNIIDVSAPGSSILTTSTGGGLSSVSGTSFSTPMTAGVLALIYSINNTITPSLAKSILFNSSVDLGVSGYDELYGWGRISAFRAVNLTRNLFGMIGKDDGGGDNETGGNESLDITSPTSPSNLQVDYLYWDRVDLVWNESSDDVGVLGYEIFRDDLLIGNTSLLYFRDDNVSENISYNYSVRAFDLRKNYSPFESIVVNVPLKLDIELVTFDYEEFNYSNISLSFRVLNLQNPVSCDLYVNYQNNSSLGVFNSSVLNFSLKNLDTGDYIWHVACNDSVSIYYSQIKYFKINLTDVSAPSVPGNLRIVDLNPINVTLFWDASIDNVGVKGYRVYRDGVNIRNTSFLGIVDRDIEDGRTYNYSLRAYDFNDIFSDLSDGLEVNVPFRSYYLSLGITAPENGEKYYETNNVSLKYYVFSERLEYLDCILNLSSSSLNLGVSLENVSNNTIQTYDLFNLSDDEYLWQVSCDDLRSINSTSVNMFEVNYSSPGVVVNDSYFDLNESTNFVILNETQLSNLRNVSLKSNNFDVKIDFLEDLNISRKIVLKNNIIFGKKSVFINSSKLREFNKSAIIRMRNLSLINPMIYRNGLPCPSFECKLISFFNKTAVFNVSHFTTYELVETPTCSDGIQNQDETGVDCGGSCSACSGGGSGGGS